MLQVRLGCAASDALLVEPTINSKARHTLWHRTWHHTTLSYDFAERHLTFLGAMENIILARLNLESIILSLKNPKSCF